jgi:hypothetical protein
MDSPSVSDREERTTMPDKSSETTLSAEEMLAIWGEPLAVYTRQQAIEDGVLVDAQRGDFREVTRQHLGTRPCVMTPAVFSLIEKAVLHPKHHNDWAGVWHDILWMLAVQRHPLKLERRRRARVRITGTGRRSIHELDAIFDGEAVTVLLPGED